MAVYRNGKCKRGQVSLEFLIVFSIFLSLLVVAVAAMVNLKRHSDNIYADERLIIAVNDIASTVNNLCVLGEGNSRAIDVGINNFEIAYDANNRELTTSYFYLGKEHSASISVKCEIEADNNPYNRNIIIYYDSGVVRIDNY